MAMTLRVWGLWAFPATPVSQLLLRRIREPWWRRQEARRKPQDVHSHRRPSESPSLSLWAEKGTTPPSS